MLKSRLALTIGDPAGIGTEIAVKYLLNKDSNKYNITLFSHKFIIKKAFQDILKTTYENNFNIVEPNSEVFDFEYGKHSKVSGKASMDYIDKAVKDILKNKYDALITCPINKKSINEAGFKFVGHTEYLAYLTDTKDISMLLAGKNIKTILVTTHCPVSKIANNLTTEKIFNAIKNAHKAGRYFGKLKPTIAVSALNPHAGDDGVLGNEEKTVIKPAIDKALSLGYDIYGIYPADTLFLNSSKWDFIISMYHDQGMIAAKMDSFGKCVNTTLNLPFIRTSVDHGTAFDIAGKNLANYSSLKEAVKLANKMVINDKLIRSI